MTSVSFFIFCCKVWYISVWNCEVLHCALHCASKQSTVHRARMALLQKHKKNLWCYLPLGERAFDTVCSICHSASLLDFKQPGSVSLRVSCLLFKFSIVFTFAIIFYLPHIANILVRTSGVAHAPAHVLLPAALPTPCVSI